MSENFLVEADGPITTITFNRPERRNCMTRDVMLEFEQLIFRVRDGGSATRVLIVTGTGAAFSAGADTSGGKDITDPRERNKMFGERNKGLPRIIGRVFDTILRLDALTIGAVNGFAVGGGWALAAAMDFVIASEKAEFWVPEVELGVPFSDPMADGPANQRAAARGLTSGATLPAILALVAELRKHSQIPIILFGYFNPVFRYGCERLCADANHAGVDGLLVVDLPPEEAHELAAPARAEGLDLIYLLAPTTPIERSRMIASSATGFLYYVSVTGVTGARAALASDLEQKVMTVKSITDLPVGVGFGISTADQAREVARFADAVVVGSAISQLIEQYQASEGLVAAVGEFASSLKQAMITARPGI